MTLYFQTWLGGPPTHFDQTLADLTDDFLELFRNLVVVIVLSFHKRSGQGRETVVSGLPLGALLVFRIISRGEVSVSNARDIFWAVDWTAGPADRRTLP